MNKSLACREKIKLNLILKFEPSRTHVFFLFLFFFFFFKEITIESRLYLIMLNVFANMMKFTRNGAQYIHEY